MISTRRDLMARAKRLATSCGASTTSRTFSETHTADAPLMSIRLTFVHENFLGDLEKKFFSHLSSAPLLVIKSDAGRSIACDPLRAAAHVDLQREDGRHRPSHLAAHHHLCVADHCHLLGHDACDRNDAEHRCARRAPLCVVQPWRVPVRHVAPLPKRRNASSAFGALCADTVASPSFPLNRKSPSPSLPSSPPLSPVPPPSSLHQQSPLYSEHFFHLFLRYLLTKGASDSIENKDGLVCRALARSQPQA